MSDDTTNEAPSKWRKKPVVVEAIRYNPPTNCQAVADFVDDWEAAECLHWCWDADDCESQTWFIETLHGTAEVAPGDWIIKGPSGDFWPCRADIFEASYERASSGSSGDDQ